MNIKEINPVLVNLDQVNRSEFLDWTIRAANVAIVQFPAAPLYKHSEQYASEASCQFSNLFCKIALSTDDDAPMTISLYLRMNGFNTWCLVSQIIVGFDKVGMAGPIMFTEAEWHEITRSVPLYGTLMQWQANMMTEVAQ